MKMISVKHYVSVLDIVIEYGDTSNIFTALNIYGWFYDTRAFWESLGNLGTLDPSNVILGRDLNLTLSSR